MKSFTMNAIEEAAPTPFEEPTHWGESFSLKSRKKNLDALGTILSEATASSTNSNDLIQIYKAADNPLAMTIASGQKGVVQVLHHIDQVGTKTSALFGLGEDATPVEIQPERLFDKKTTRLPSLEQIGNLEDFTTLPKPKSTAQEVTVSNTIFFPQDVGSYLAKNLKSNQANDVLKLTIDYVEELDHKNGIETFSPVDPSGEHEEEGSEDENPNVKNKVIIYEVHADSAIHKYSHLIKTLVKWTSNPRAIQACTLPTEDDGVKLWGRKVHDDTLVRKQKAPNKTGDKSILDSPTSKNPNVNLTGTKPQPTSETLNPRNLNNAFNKAGESIPPGTPRAGNKDSNLTLPPSPLGNGNLLNQPPPAGTSPFASSNQQGQQVPQNDANQLLLQSLLQQASNNIGNGNANNPNNNGGTDTNALLQATLAALLYGQSKSTDVQERMVEVQEATLKLKEESSKNKISDPVANFLKNAFTTDGVNPRAEIPDGLKSLMKSKPDETAMNLDLILNQEKTKAKPTANFIKALNSGKYTHEIGKPGGLTPLSIPFTQMGSGQENHDIEQLLAMEANGDELSPQQKKILNLTSIHPPRTINYALRMAQGYKSTIKQGGDDTVPFSAIEEICEWIAENEQTLSENTAAFDKHLPAKLLYTIGAQFNSYFNESKFRVPSQKWLDFSTLQNQLMNNQYYITLPDTITKTLEPSKRRREDDPNNNNRDEDQKEKRRMVIQEHKNQPIQLKSSRDFHSKVMVPFMKQLNELNLSIPKFDEDTQECLRYSLLGECNSNCTRKKAHKAVHAGSRRYKQLLEFRKKAIEHYNNNKSNDDPNFS